jgi:hypothetical protein
MSGEFSLNAGWSNFLLNVRRSIMKEIVDGLRGPAMGVVFVIIVIGGTMVVAAFAALVAQMGLLLRMRPRENDNRTQTHNGYRVAESRQSSNANRYGSPKDSGYEPSSGEVVDGIWWQVQ